MGLFNKTTMVDAADALPGRPQAVSITNRHFVHETSLVGPFDDHLATAVFGLGCFWGAERLFWELPGVVSTAVGYAGGYTENPTYEEVCSGLTGHAEVVLVVYDPAELSYSQLVTAFFESHDPTQGMRQGNDRGSQYRSVIQYADSEQQGIAEDVRLAYQSTLSAAGLGSITTSTEPLSPFFYAEDYHQQYLAKNPTGYCGIGGTGVSCPIPTQHAS